MGADFLILGILPTAKRQKPTANLSGNFAGYVADTLQSVMSKQLSVVYIFILKILR